MTIRDRLKQFEDLTLELQEGLERLRREEEKAGLAEETLGYGCLCGAPELDRARERAAELARERAKEAAAALEWIEGIEDSVSRRAMKLRYLDGLSWKEVARRMGYQTESGPRMLCERALEKAGER